MGVPAYGEWYEGMRGWGVLGGHVCARVWESEEESCFWGVEG